MKDHIAAHIRIEESLLSMVQNFESKLAREKQLSMQIHQKENQHDINEVFRDNLNSSNSGPMHNNLLHGLD